jgi:hypothetical protein
MLTARLFTTRTRRLLAFSIIFAGLMTGTASFAPRARACPAPPPQPLRRLYTESARIVVARVGKSEQVKTEEEDSESRLMKTALEVSSTLKGETVEPVVYLYHWTWGDEYQDPISEATSSDQLLLFLVRREDGDGYEIEDMTYGLKKLSDADLKIYVRRIEELAAIMKQDEPNQAEIVEWLVRCAEEPATRWEGAFELNASNSFLQAKKEQKPEVEGEAQAQPVDEQAAVVDGESGAGRDPVYFEGMYEMDETFASLLTPAQKERVASALFSADAITNADYPLINLVKDWNDARLLPFLLTHLRSAADTSPYYTPELMMMVAEIIGDDALVALVDDYRTLFYNGAEEGLGSSQEGEEQAASSEQQEAQAQASDFKQRLNAKLDHFIALAQSSTPQ